MNALLGKDTLQNIWEMDKHRIIFRIERSYNIQDSANLNAEPSISF